MKNEYICHCGLYCENCAVKSRVEPASKQLYTEMQKAGFEDIINFIPDGEAFWRFLKSVAGEGACVSCKAGSGNPGCKVRTCAAEKGIELCALCPDYPCDKFPEFFADYPILRDDNELLRTQGFDAWARMQDNRHTSGFSYTD